MQDSIITQRKKTSLSSSFFLFLSCVIFFFAIFFFGNNHYQQTKSSLSYKASEEEFALLPDKFLPPKKPKKKIKLRSLNNLEINERISAQNQWKKTSLPRLLKDEKIRKRIDEFLEKFYHKFLEEGLEKDEKRWKEEIRTIRPKKVDGRITSEETLNSDIEACKKIFPKVREAEIYWEGFAGWLTENEEGEKEDGEDDNKVTMGRCDSENKGGVTWRRKTNFWGDPKEDLCYWTERHITIKLKPELFFLRHNFNSWVTKDVKTGGYSQLKIGWNQLVETIAHELAHAVINTILINDKSAKLVEGHGGLHDKFTEKIEKMIKEEHSYSEDFRGYVENL